MVKKVIMTLLVINALVTASVVVHSYYNKTFIKYNDEVLINQMMDDLYECYDDQRNLAYWTEELKNGLQQCQIKLAIEQNLLSPQP
jgi:hypothetical protein